MGYLTEKLLGSWRTMLSFIIVWVIPFIVICGLIYLGYMFGKHKKTIRRGLVPKQIGSDFAINILLDEVDKQKYLYERLRQVSLKRDVEERQRRKNLLTTLRQEYTQNNKLDEKQPLPKDWVEKRLYELGETWRQDKY